LFVSCFTAPAPPWLHPLSLHAALPISSRLCSRMARSSGSLHASTRWLYQSTASSSSMRETIARVPSCQQPIIADGRPACVILTRSEEHTSELQSRENLVCRLLLEKKNK